MSTIIKKRAIWCERDEMVLLELWGDRAMDLRRAKRNGHIFAEISIQMAGKYSSQDVHVKIRNMTQKYREEKKKVGPSGGSPSTWKHYAAVHQIIGATAVNNADIFESFSLDSGSASSSQPMMASSPAIPSSTSPTSTPISSVSPSQITPPSPSPSQITPPSPSPLPALSPLDTSSSTSGRKRNFSGEVVKIMNEQTEVLKSVMEDTRQLTNEVVSALREHNDSTKEFMSLMRTLIEKL